MTSARFLAEQHLAHLRIVDVDVEGFLHSHLEPALAPWPRHDSVAPAPDVGKGGKVMAMALGPTSPADACNIRNGVASGEEFTILQPPVHHAIDPIHLVH